MKCRDNKQAKLKYIYLKGAIHCRFLLPAIVGYAVTKLIGGGYVG